MTIVSCCLLIGLVECACMCAHMHVVILMLLCTQSSYSHSFITYGLYMH